MNSTDACPQCGGAGVMGATGLPCPACGGCRRRRRNPKGLRSGNRRRTGGEPGANRHRRSRHTHVGASLRSRGVGAGTPRSRPTGAGPAPRADDSTGDPKAKARIALARAVWAAANPETKGTPLTMYLGKRGVWPEPMSFGDGWPALPDAFRHASRAALEGVNRAFAGRVNVLAEFPPDAVGAMVAGFRCPGDTGDVQAVPLMH